MNIQEKVGVAVQRVADAIKRFKPSHVFGLYSGGHDSFSACFVASLAGKFDGVVHINTGIGVEATHDHVRHTAKHLAWVLHERYAIHNRNAKGQPDPQVYDDLVMQWGFPGPGHHNKMYNRLKERSLRCLERDCGATCKHKILFISGCRSQESTRRMGTTKEIDVDGRRVWCAAIHDWSKQDTSELIDATKATRNPVVDLIHKSGECLCGAFAEKGELEELKLWPQTRPAYDRIIKLQEQVKAVGFPWGWEDSPPKEYLEHKRGQEFFPEIRQHLCWACLGKSDTPKP